MQQNNIKDLEIKRSHTLINISGNLSVNATKVWLLGLSAIKWLDADKVEINNKGQVITTLSKDFLLKYIPQVINQKSYIRQLSSYCDELIKTTVGTISSKEDSFTKIGAYATKAEYLNNELKITHNRDVVELVDVEKRYCQYLYKRVANLNSKNYIKTYDLCYSFIDLGKRKESIVFLRTFYNIGPSQFKQTSDFIKKIIEKSVDYLNIDKNIDIRIDFKPIKTGRKITHIEFTMERKGQHPLLEMNKANNDLRTLLVQCGLSPKKIQTLAKYPPHHLITAANSVLKFKESGKVFKNGVEAYFVGTLKKIVDDKKPQPGLIVQSFLDLLDINSRKDLTKEFKDTLTADELAGYDLLSPCNKALNNVQKQAIKSQYNKQFGAWVYYTKIDIFTNKKSKNNKL